MNKGRTGQRKYIKEASKKVTKCKNHQKQQPKTQQTIEQKNTHQNVQKKIKKIKNVIQ